MHLRLSLWQHPNNPAYTKSQFSNYWIWTVTIQQKKSTVFCLFVFSLLFHSCLMLLLLFVFLLLLFFSPSPFCRLSVDHYYQIPKLSKTVAKNVIFPKPSRPEKRCISFPNLFQFFKDALYPAQTRTHMIHTQKHIHTVETKIYCTHHYKYNIICTQTSNTKINLQPVVESLSACLGFFTDTISTSESSWSLSATNTSVSIISQV